MNNKDQTAINYAELNPERAVVNQVILDFTLCNREQIWDLSLQAKQPDPKGKIPPLALHFI